MLLFASILDDSFPRATAGFLLAFAIASIAVRARSLTRSGAVAATLIGGGVVAGAGWWVGLVLVVFFISSSLLSTLRRSQSLAAEQARGKQRDAWQVLANGGVAAVFALVSLLVDHPTPLILATVGSLAGAAADTWATELGRLSRSTPRLITTGRRVPAGTSGAISVPGTLASLAAAVCIALLASRLELPDTGISRTEVFTVIVIAGLAGSLIDSLLGATVQERRRCPTCQQPTEQRTHRCGTATIHDGGWGWMTNDTVNGLAVLVSGTVAGLAATIAG